MRVRLTWLSQSFDAAKLGRDTPVISPTCCERDLEFARIGRRLHRAFTFMQVSAMRVITEMSKRTEQAPKGPNRRRGGGEESRGALSYSGKRGSS